MTSAGHRPDWARYLTAGIAAGIGGAVAAHALRHARPRTPAPDAPVPGTPLPGAAVPGTAVPGAPVPGSPVPGAPVPRPEDHAASRETILFPPGAAPAGAFLAGRGSRPVLGGARPVAGARKRRPVEVRAVATALALVLGGAAAGALAVSAVTEEPPDRTVFGYEDFDHREPWLTGADGFAPSPMTVRAGGIVPMGTTVTLDRMRVTLDMVWDPAVWYRPAGPAAGDGRFVALTVSIENTGVLPVPADVAEHALLVDAFGAELHPHATIVETMDPDIEPLETGVVQLVFEVPADAAPTRFRLALGPGGPGRAQDWTLS